MPNPPLSVYIAHPESLTGGCLAPRNVLSWSVWSEHCLLVKSVSYLFIFLLTVTRHVLVLNASVKLFNVFSKKSLKGLWRKDQTCVDLYLCFWETLERRGECCDVFQVHAGVWPLSLCSFVINTLSVKCKIHKRTVCICHQRPYQFYYPS